MYEKLISELAADWRRTEAEDSQAINGTPLSDKEILGLLGSLVEVVEQPDSSTESV